MDFNGFLTELLSERRKSIEEDADEACNFERIRGVSFEILVLTCGISRPNIYVNRATLDNYGS